MDLIWLCLLFPLAGFAINALLGQWLPRRAHGWIATAAILAAFVVACIVLADLLSLAQDDRHRDLILYNWVVADSFIAPFGAWLDPLSVLMLLIVTGVGFLIHLYAVGYMADDEGQRRFFAYLNLFVLAMLILVLADNFMLLLVGWGGVGFASFALISHYFYREDAADAAVKAFVVNTLGDVGMMLGIFLIYLKFGTVQYFSTPPGGITAAGGSLFTNPGVFDSIGRAGLSISSNEFTAITLLLLVGALAKSGQVPLHTWLPDAMAGPTPVSALIHAATMVTAGVYLLARCWPLYEQAPGTLTLIAWLGAFTALFGATIGLVQMNVKRVLAFSTISQLGYMFLAAGVGAYSAGIFHLLTHAFFKALLFLAAGVAIHALHGEEDLRNMGGLRRQLPLAWAAFGIGGLAIAGIPPFSGFFSKDEIIWSAFVSPRGNVVLGLVALITGGITAFYVFRAFFLAFHGASRAATIEVHRDDHGGPTAAGAPGHELHLPGPEMQVPLVVLSILAFAGGWLLIPNLVSTFDTYLEPVFAGLPIQIEQAEGASYWLLAIVAALFGAAGIVFAYMAYVARPEISANLARQFAGAHRVLTNRYYVDELYDFAIVRPVKTFARWLSRFFDRGIDNTTNATSFLVREASVALRELQTGYVRNYALLIFVGAVLVIGFIVFGIGSGA